MNRQYRLKNSKDFKRVRQYGSSYAHPFVVLIATPSAQKTSRIGITASRAIGNAVQRNRAKRKLRAIINQLIPDFARNVDIVMIARPMILKANRKDLILAIESLAEQAGLLEK